jgi:hypothetical protein
VFQFGGQGSVFACLSRHFGAYYVTVVGGLFLWVLVTVSHFWLTDRLTRAVRFAQVSLDERIFVTTLGGIATLSFVLHVVACTVGLSLLSGISGLVVLHVILRFGIDPGARTAPPIAAAERIALTVVFGILLSWISAAASSVDIYGPDAAHYHVPYAVNIAAGDSLFALPATPHLYPMTGSVVAAWFIVPLGDPLLVDLAMALPFVLLLASINYLVRTMTGVSGTAWSSWLCLALFATPLFRSASAGAADLWFAAAFASALAIVVASVARGYWRSADVVLFGCALGLLVGSKTTGVAAAALLMVGAAIVSGFRAMLRGSTEAGDAAGFRSVLVAGLIAIGAGGIWLLRNWIQFGSPLAPAGLQVMGWTIFEGETHQGTFYFSVLGEMQTNRFDLRARSAFWIKEWLGPVFLPSLGLLSVHVIDLALTYRRRTTDSRWWARVACLGLVLGVGAVLIWLLIGAPWTALERSRGLTLRYALPVAALLPVLVFTALMPLRWPWFERDRMATRALHVGLAAISCWWFWRAAAGATAPWALPPIDPRWLLVSAVIVFSGLVWRAQGKFRSVATGAIAVAVAGFLTFYISAADRAERARTTRVLQEEEASFAGGGMRANEWRALYLTVRSDERARGVSCGASRFFALVRYDEPMALQPPEMTNRSYYAGRDLASARRAGPMGPCDYIVTTAALQATDKGHNIADALGGGAALQAIETGTTLLALRLR